VAAGTDAAAAAATVAAGLLVGQVGAGALWVTDEFAHTILRIDEQTGTACVIAGAGRRDPNHIDGPSHAARFYAPCCIVWDAARERAIVCDYTNQCVRAITRAPPPPPPPPPATATVAGMTTTTAAAAAEAAAAAAPVEQKSSAVTTKWSAWIVSTLIHRTASDLPGLFLPPGSEPCALALDPDLPHVLYVTSLRTLLVADFSTGTAYLTVPQGAPSLSYPPPPHPPT
jgi:hypothetical protein